MTVLTDGQYQLDDGPVMGWHTNYVLGPPALAEAELASQDKANPGADGRRFGRDYLAGETITLDISVSGTRETVHGLHETLQAYWRARSIRHVPGEVSVLRYNIGNRPRRVYGRPRKFTPNFDRSYLGVIVVTATFDTAEPVYYEDVSRAETVELVPPSGGGVTSPVISPVVTLDTGLGDGVVTIGGTSPTWVVMEIHGPISNPVVEALNHWSFQLSVSIADGETVTIDPRPWSRGVRSSFGANYAGKFRATDPSLSSLALPPGATEFVLRGNDITGTSWMTAQWYDARDAF